MNSLHFTISKYILSGILLVALVTGVIIDRFTRQQFNSQFNKTLQNQAWTLATLTDQKNGKITFNFTDTMMPEFGISARSEYFQLWSGNGDLLQKSHSLANTELPFLNIAMGDTVIQDIELPDGKQGRFVAIHFTPQSEDDSENRPFEHSSNSPLQPPQTVILMIVKNRSELIHKLLINRVVIIVSFISMLLISYLIIHIATKKGLSPLTALSTQVQNIDDQTLDTQIQPDKMYSELSAITLQLNYLFNRLNASFTREKRFSANVSHELRTPIAELLTLSEVAGSQLNDPQKTSLFFDDVKDIAQNMSSIVDNMLTMAQSEPGGVNREYSVFNLNECIQSAIRQAESINKNNLKIEWDQTAFQTIRIYNDEAKFSQILINIFSNAFKYACKNSVIRIKPVLQDQLLSLSVSNNTFDLQIDDLEHLTESFWRKDVARTAGKNSGLGLTLVKILCQVLDIKLDFSLTDDGLYTVSLGNLSAHKYNI